MTRKRAPKKVASPPKKRAAKKVARKVTKKVAKKVAAKKSLRASKLSPGHVAIWGSHKHSIVRGKGGMGGSHDERGGQAFSIRSVPPASASGILDALGLAGTRTKVLSILGKKGRR